MRRVKRFWAGLLALSLLLTLVPAAAAAETTDGEFWVRDIMVPEEKNPAVVWAMAEEDCLMQVVMYDEQGRMLWSKAMDVTGSSEEQRIPVTGLPAERPMDFVLDAFLLDKDTFTPLCEGTGFAALTGEEGYAITALSGVLQNYTATVTTRDACALQFQMLSEDGETVLYAGEVDLEEGLTQESIPFQCFGAPDYYLVRAVLRDGEGRPLCRPFTDRSHAMERRSFERKKEMNYSDSPQFLDLLEDGDDNFAVLHSDVLKLAETGDVNVLVSRENGVCTFANADAALTGLKVGDKLSFRDLDGQYAAVKAAAVRVEGSTVTVTEDPEAGLADFYQIIKVDAKLEGMAPEAAVSLQGTGAGDLPGDVFGIKVGPQFSARINTPFGAVKAELRVGGDFRLHYDFKQNYLESRFQIAYVGQTDVTVGPNSNCKGELPLVDIPMAGIPDLADVALNLDVEYEVDCKGGLSMVSTVKQTMGYIYNSRDGGQAIKKTGVEQDELNTEAAMAFDFDVSTGLRASLNASLLDDSGRVGLGAGAGVGAKGRLEAQPFPDLPVRDSYHACALCMSGNAYGYSEVEMAVDFNIRNRWKGTLMDLDLVRAELEVGNFYCSLDNEEGSIHGGQRVFAWEEECPNRKYRAEVRTLNVKGEEVPGCDVSVLTALDQPLASGASPLAVYLYPGTYRASAIIERLKAQEQFAVKDGAVTVSLRGEKMDLRGTVTDAVTDKTISGVSVTVEENGQVVDTASASTSGIYSTSLIAGTYTLIFTAEGYEPASHTVTLTENTTLNVELQPKEYVIRFSSGEGSGTMEDGTVYHGQHYTLPENGFAAPEGKRFKGWSVNGTEYPVGGVLSFVQSDKTVTAVWENGPVGVSLKVLDQNGNPPRVSHIELRDTKRSVKYLSLDSNGCASLELEPGLYTLMAEGTSGYIAHEIVEVGEEALQLTMQLTYGNPQYSYDGDTKTLTITGTGGPMWNYATNGDYYSNAPWNYYLKYGRWDPIEHIEIYNVTSIGNNAFYGYENLKSVKLPDNLQWIGVDAFCGCKSLAEINLPDSLRVLETYAFMRCTSLTEIEIPGSVAFMGKQVFAFCVNLTRAKLEEGVTMVTDGMFDSCNLEWVDLPDSLESIGKRGFYLNDFESIEIPSGVTSIGDEAFAQCHDLKHFTFADAPLSTLTIGEEAFYACQAMEEIDFHGRVASIGASAFILCANLKTVTLHEGLLSIGAQLFERTATGMNLTEIELPDSLVSIGEAAFRNSGLTEITIPGNVTEIGDEAFAKCTSLKDAVFLDGVQTVGAYMFDGCTALERVELPESVVQIQGAAFRDCKQLWDVDLPDSVQKIGGSAFTSCSSLTGISIPSGVAELGYSAFGWTGLEWIALPVSLTAIGNDAFSSCWDLTDVYYEGTEEQWNAIAVGSDNARLTKSATIHFESPKA